jgi:hypothetical protein
MAHISVPCGSVAEKLVKSIIIIYCRENMCEIFKNYSADIAQKM